MTWPIVDNSEGRYEIPETSGSGSLGTIGSWATVDTKVYRWIKRGGLVLYEHRCESTTASSSGTAVWCDIPSDVPKPVLFSGSGDPEWALPANSVRSTGVANAIDKSVPGVIYYASSDFIFYGYTTAAEASKLWLFSAFWQTANT